MSTHTLGTGWYNNKLALENATNKSWISAEITRKTSEHEEYSKEEWVQEVATRFQGIPSWACWYYQSPRMWLEVLEAWYFHQTVWRRSLGPSSTPGRMEVVLEAQFYTRQYGGGP